MIENFFSNFVSCIAYNAVSLALYFIGAFTKKPNRVMTYYTIGTVLEAVVFYGAYSGAQEKGETMTLMQWSPIVCAVIFLFICMRHKKKAEEEAQKFAEDSYNALHPAEEEEQNVKK